MLNKNKLHILFLSSWYPSRVFPTNGDFVQRHAETMSIEHEITLIHVVTDESITKKVEIVDETINNVRTIIAYVPSKNIISKLYYFYKTYSSIIKSIGFYNLVHLNITYPTGLIALYLKKFKKKPYTITEHWTGYQYPLNESIGYFQKMITKTIIKNASFVSPVSDNLATEMKEFGLTGNYSVIPNIVNTDLFSVKTNISDSFKILHVSSMRDNQKNVSGIIKTVSNLQKKIQNIQLVLVGEKSNRYQELASSLKLKNITFIDQISQKELTQHFHNANLFVLFSNHENLPCVILESFSTGTPVISTNVGGITEFFPENFGKIIPKNDLDKLESEILNFYNSENKYATPTVMHEYAVNNFSQKTICEKYTNQYLKMIE